MSAGNTPTLADSSGPAGAMLIEEATSPLNPSDRAFWIGATVVGLSILSALGSYLILTGLTSIAPRNEFVWAALAINVTLILAMLGIIAWQARGLVRAWKDRVPGARLHTRIVALFSVIAAIPTILLAVAATTTFSRSLDGWFSVRTRAIVENSYDVAKAYVDEHGQIIRTDVVNMVRDLNGLAATVKDSPEEFQKLLIGQAGLRDLPAAYVIDNQGVPTVLAIEDPKLPYIVPPIDVIQLAEAGQVPLLMSNDSYRVAAIAKDRKSVV